ncbi:hypothetical protein M0802_007214 [Mischocyttarus mexicanus]|nr:hypothetical protein M0802_007214 [Mischocyttarus mexicanus]
MKKKKKSKNKNKNKKKKKKKKKKEEEEEEVVNRPRELFNAGIQVYPVYQTSSADLGSLEGLGFQVRVNQHGNGKPWNKFHVLDDLPQIGDRCSVTEIRGMECEKAKVSGTSRIVGKIERP